MKTIGLACDHAGFELKEYVRGWLEAKGWAYKDFGTNSTASVDYRIMLIRWLLQWNRENVIPVSLSVAVETESI